MAIWSWSVRRSHLYLHLHHLHLLWIQTLMLFQTWIITHTSAHVCFKDAVHTHDLNGWKLLQISLCFLSLLHSPEWIQVSGDRSLFGEVHWNKNDSNEHVHYLKRYRIHFYISEYNGECGELMITHWRSDYMFKSSFSSFVWCDVSVLMFSTLMPLIWPVCAALLDEDV